MSAAALALAASRPAPSHDTAHETRADLDATIGWWTRPGRVILGEQLRPADDGLDTRAYIGRRTEGALTVFQTTGYDPGNQAYRFHSALNRTSPHASLFARVVNSNPFTNARQIDPRYDMRACQLAMATADVVHCHMHPWALSYFGVRWRGTVVLHYHGSEEPGKPWGLVQHARDRRLGAVQVGARLDHEDYGVRDWLPMAQPVGRLHALRRRYARPGVPGVDRPFRVGHSPTARQLKGTAGFLAVCAQLVRAGLPIEPVLIERHKHHVALAWKATCDAFVDSRWLGIQGSGLEAGAMEMPVIAGDTHVAELYARRVGHVPYLFADTDAELAAALRALVESPAQYAEHATRVHRYVWDYHRDAAVAARYAAILAAAVPALADRLALARETPAEYTAVPAMRPTDALPWLAPDLNYAWQTSSPPGAPIPVAGPWTSSTTSRPCPS